MNQLLQASRVQPERLERVALFIDGANLYAASPSVREVVRRLEMISHFQRGGTEE
jgi:hypothetical protein